MAEKNHQHWMTVLLGIICLALCTSIGFAQSIESRSREGDAVRYPRAGKVLHPFHGSDLTGLSTWLQGLGDEDPNEVFSVVNGVLRVSGDGMGYLGTEQEYTNYHLSVEYRWGKKTKSSDSVRNSGILLHANGPDGNFKDKWMASVECQLAQGCEGDLIVLRGVDAFGKTIPVTLASDTVLASDGRTRWRSVGKKTVYSGRQFWWSGHQVGFEEVLDARGKNDLASPLGEWTLVECICSSDRITIKINGVTVNECYEVFPSSGRILFQNEGNEIYFRNFELRPVALSDAESSPCRRVKEK